MKNKKISKKELIEEVIKLDSKLGRRPQKRDNSSLYRKSRLVFGSWNNLMKAAGYKVRYYQFVEVPKFDENFTYFLGLVITDGHIRKLKDPKAYVVSIYTSYPEERDLIIMMIKKLFNYDPGISSRIYGFSKRPNYEIRISSKNLVYELINKFGIPSGNKSSNVVVPQKVFSSNYKNRISFVRGVIDGDGYISHRGIKIASGSIKFLEGMRDLLNCLDIDSTKVIRDNRKTNTFSIRINKKKDLVKIKEIYDRGFSYPRKKNTIDNI